MSDGSKIEWTDATWNPVRGCTKISPGCAHCYAETFAERFRGVPGHPYEQGFDLKLIPEKLTDPFRWPARRRVFVNSMSDLFHADVPEDYIERVCQVMAAADWHTYQVLTKRSERMSELLRTRLRFAAALLVCAAVIAAALPLANRAVGAKPSGVGLSLVIFDLGGITRFSGTDAFPPDDDVDDPVAVNRGCYKPQRWDSYSWWVPNPCPLGFDAMDDLFKQSGESPYRHWLGAVATHPFAYAEHRLTHFNINIRFLVHDEVERPVMGQIPPNDWGFRLTPNPLLTWLDRGARWSAHTPLVWPVWC